MSASEKPNIGCVDLFCGAGGLSLGLKDAGLSVEVGVDADERCRFPYEHNTGVPFERKDIAVSTHLRGREISPTVVA